MSRARRGHALRRRYGRAAGDPMKAFQAAVRKIERMIADVAAGTNTTSSARDIEMPVFNAINKLDDRVYKAWRSHGNDALREEGYEVVKALRAKMRAAVDVGFEARQSNRRGEIKVITEKERERIANMNPSERALYNYQQELKLTRGGR